MEPLHMPATKNTPQVDFDPVSGRFRIEGNSIPENASEHYQPIIHWLEQNLGNLPDGSTFEFCLPYFNSSSMKALYMVLMEIQKETEKGRPMGVNWMVEHEDEFMIEAAETFTELLTIPIKVVNC